MEELTTSQIFRFCWAETPKRSQREIKDTRITLLLLLLLLLLLFIIPVLSSKGGCWNGILLFEIE